VDELKPQGRLEMSFVEQIAISDWKVRRVLSAEKGEIINGYAEDADTITIPSILRPGRTYRTVPSSDVADKLLRCHVAMQRQKLQAVKVLRELQQERRKLPARSATLTPAPPENGNCETKPPGD